MMEKREGFFDRLMDLPHGWAGDPHNEPFSIVFLEEMKEFSRDMVAIMGFEPVMCPMENNSIDFHWKNENVQLLINVPEREMDTNCGLYARTLDGKNEIKFSGSTEDLTEKAAIVKQWNDISRSLKKLGDVIDGE